MQSWALAVFLKNIYLLLEKKVSTTPISVLVLFKKPTPSQINLIEKEKNVIFHY